MNIEFSVAFFLKCFKIFVEICSNFNFFYYFQYLRIFDNFYKYFNFEATCLGLPVYWIVEELINFKLKLKINKESKESWKFNFWTTFVKFVHFLAKLRLIKFLQKSTKIFKKLLNLLWHKIKELSKLTALQFSLNSA